MNQNNIISLNIIPSKWEQLSHFGAFLFLNSRTIDRGFIDTVVSNIVKTKKIELLQEELNSRYCSLLEKLELPSATGKTGRSPMQQVLEDEGNDLISYINHNIQELSQHTQYTEDIKLVLIAIFLNFMAICQLGFNQAESDISQHQDTCYNLYVVLRDVIMHHESVTRVNIEVLYGVRKRVGDDYQQVAGKRIPDDVQQVLDKYKQVPRMIVDQFGHDGRKLNVLRVIRYILLTIASIFSFALVINLLTPSLLINVALLSNAFTNTVVFLSTLILAQLCTAFDEYKFSASIATAAQAVMNDETVKYVYTYNHLQIDAYSGNVKPMED